MIEEDDPDEWLATDHEDVYYRSPDDQFRRGEMTLAKYIVNHLPDWSVVITMGPYRGYDFQYQLYPDDRIIHLDCYSVSMVIYGPDIPYRQKHSVIEHGESVLRDLVESIAASDAPLRFTDS